MFFQDAPPDTSAYMIAGYTVFFVISAIYLVSLVVRRRNLEQDLQTLESIEAEGRGSGARRATSEVSTKPTRARRQAAARRRPARKKVTRRK
jgi:hypothetical protein